MYKLKWSEVVPKNMCWAITNDAVCKGRRLPMDEKNHYLMETNLNVDKEREIKDLTQKSPR